MPTDLSSNVEARVTGLGQHPIFDSKTGGFDLFLTQNHVGAFDTAGIVIIARLSVGEIEVHS